MALAGDPAQAIHRRESAPPGQVQAQFARDFDPAPFALGGTHRATRALWMAADSYARASRGLDGRYSGQASGPESLLGAPIEIAVRSDEAGEARWIGERLRVLRNTAGWPSDSVFGRAAILTRTHSRAIAIREALVARHGPAIPCEVLGWKAPFQLQDRVTLCAIHQAKGLEFDYVFIAGAVDGELPDAPADDRARRDEEDRLFYVAMTRARKRLFISYHAADERGRARRPSPCLGRIDPAYCADV
jgi:superfamily I DNA/RNA helicase